MPTIDRLIEKIEQYLKGGIVTHVTLRYWEELKKEIKCLEKSMQPREMSNREKKDILEEFFHE